MGSESNSQSQKTATASGGQEHMGHGCNHRIRSLNDSSSHGIEQGCGFDGTCCSTLLGDNTQFTDKNLFNNRRFLLL